jgi:hypothetical protein
MLRSVGQVVAPLAPLEQRLPDRGGREADLAELLNRRRLAGVVRVARLPSITEQAVVSRPIDALPKVAELRKLIGGKSHRVDRPLWNRVLGVVKWREPLPDVHCAELKLAFLAERDAPLRLIADQKNAIRDVESGPKAVIPKVVRKRPDPPILLTPGGKGVRVYERLNRLAASFVRRVPCRTHLRNRDDGQSDGRKRSASGGYGLPLCSVHC